MKSGSYKVLITTLIIFVLLQSLLSLDLRTLEQKKIFIPPPKDMKLFTFGFNDLFSSLLWVRLLQDIHICDQEREQGTLAPLKNGDDPLSEILERQMPAPRCEMGWVFQMLDTITDLAPNFYTAYADGATMLSVLVDDRIGASILFEKAATAFPEDWQILYRAAYHELFEMQNPEQAADLLRRAGEFGAPPWVYALSAKLYTRLGRAEFAKTVLEAVLVRKPEAATVERVRIQLEAINKALQETK